MVEYYFQSNIKCFVRSTRTIGEDLLPGITIEWIRGLTSGTHTSKTHSEIRVSLTQPLRRYAMEPPKIGTGNASV